MGLILPQQTSIADLQTNYMTGAFTHCWESWRQENITPGYNKFYFIVDGEFYLRIDKKEYITRKGDLFLLPHNSNQSYYHISEKLASKYWFHFAVHSDGKDLMEQIKTPFLLHLEPDSPAYRYVEDGMKRIVSWQDSEMLFSALNRKFDILELLAFFLENTRLEAIPQQEGISFSSLLTYIDEHLSQDLSVEELCGMMHLNYDYFIRRFKREMGMTSVAYINDRRVNRAKNLLQFTDLPIKQVAIQAGFSSNEYFARVFKKKTGYTPRWYREVAVAKAPDTSGDEKPAL